jgi:putative addiction module component (TIGR02574 family)
MRQPVFSCMIAERLAGVSELSPQEKWLLAGELWDAVAEDPTAVPQNDALRELIRERWDQYLANPEQGTTWQDIQRRLGPL